MYTTASPDVNDHLSKMSGQMMQQWQYGRSSRPSNHIPISQYIVQDTTNYMSEKWTTNFVVLKSGHYKICSLKKQTLQTFVMKKAHTTNFYDR